MNMIINVFALLFIEVITQSEIILVTFASPVPVGEEAWLNPCGGSRPVHIAIPLPVIPVTRNITQEFRTLQTISLEAEDKCETMSSLMVKTVLTKSYVEQVLKSKPSLTGFPKPGPFFTLGETKEQVLQRAVKKASEVEVFLEQALRDTKQSYTVELKQIKNKNMDLLCQMHVMLNNVTSSVSRDIFPQSLTNLNLSDTDDRNHCIIRDAKLLYLSIAQGVNSYLDQLS